MKRVTTSAQKTVGLEKDAGLARLSQAVAVQEHIEFTQTSNPDVRRAQLDDGTKLSVACFATANGRSVVMIDHANVAEEDRQRWQRHWRKTIDSIFD